MKTRFIFGTLLSGTLLVTGCESIPSRSDLSPDNGAQYASLDELLGSRSGNDQNSQIELADPQQVVEASDENIQRAWSRVSNSDCEGAMDIASGILRAESIESVSPQASYEVRLIQAECTYRSGDMAGANNQFESLLNEQRDGRVLRSLGVIAARGNDYTTARTYLDEARVLTPNDWRIWNTLGFLEDINQNWVGAQTAYEQAARLEPDRAAPLNNLGLSFLQRGDYDAANAAFTEAVEREANFAPAETNLRIAMIMQGQVERALWGIDDTQRPEVLNNAGVIARSQGDLELAASLFQRALDESPVFYEQAYENLQMLERPDP